MSRSALNVLSRTFDLAAQLGATIPKHITAGHARLVAISEKVEAMSRADVGGAVLDALDADRDPLTDPAVQQEVARYIVVQHANGVATALASRTAGFAAEYAEDILEGFRKPFAQAAAVLADVHAQLGDVDLDDAAAVLKRGGDAARLWGEAKTADQHIRSIREAWAYLAGAAPHLRVDKRYALLQIADVPPARYWADGLHGVDLRAWEVVRRGLPLSLATPSSFAEREAAVRVEAARIEQQRPTFADSFRKAHGTGQPIIVPQPAA